MKSSSQSYLYLIFAIVLLTISIIGVISLYRRSSSPSVAAPTPTSSPRGYPSPSYDFETASVSPTITSGLSMDEIEPTPTHQQYTGDTFQLKYPSYRKLTIENETSGKRYVFYSNIGNITLHSGSAWSWTHPSRQFSSTLLVADQPTFRYDTATQTIIDFQQGDQLFTIQCVHNGKPTLKTECDQFVASFQFSNKN